MNRARNLGVSFEGTWNAIIDLASVEVGATTLN